MFLRTIRNLRVVQKWQTLPQCLSNQTVTCRSYATFDVNNGTSSRILKVKESVHNISAACHLSPQSNLKEDKEGAAQQAFEVAVNKLESSYQMYGFIGIEQLKPFTDTLNANSNLNISHEQGLFLLNVAGCEMPALSPNERMSNFQFIWEYLHQLNRITKDHYHSMLQVLQYNRSPLKDYKIFLQEYEKHNGLAKDVLPQLLAVAGASGNVKQSTEILAEMRALQLALTEYDFSSLLMAHARANDINGFKTVQETMQATGLPISTETQSTLIAASMENGDEVQAMAVLKQFHGQFRHTELLKMLQSQLFSKNISKDFIVQLVKEFDADFVKGVDVPIPLRLICVELLNNNKLDDMMSIINALPTPVFQDNQDIDTYGKFLLFALFKAECELEKIIEIAIQLEDSGKNTRALHTAAEIALKRSPPLAIKIFDALKAREHVLRPHYFWPLIMYNFRRHGEASIIRTIKTMQTFNVECDHPTIVEYVIPRLSTILTNPKLALTQLESAGVKTSSVLTPIVFHMLSQNKWFEVASLVEPYTTKINNLELITPLCAVAVHVRATKRYHMFAKLLSALAKKHVDHKQDFIGQFLIELLTTQARIRNDLSSCKSLFGEMHKFGVNISAPAATKIQSLITEANQQASEQYLQDIQYRLKGMTKRHLNLANHTEDGSLTVSSFIKHPRDMTYHELECHLVELESKRMNTRGVLRRLLQVCVHSNLLERALEIKNKLEMLNVHKSPGMLANIFELYIKLEDQVKAQQCLQTMQESYPGFIVDQHKLLDYAALMVKNGQLEAAKNLLEERCLNHKIIGGDYILKNVWNFLTNVAHLAAVTKDLPRERNLTKETHEFLKKIGYCRAQNAILGPIVRERLLRNDMAAAINELKELATQYKHTPLQFELLCLIVRMCNGDEELKQKYNCSAEEAQQMLADLTEIVTKVHGIVNMNSGLLVAFAESGTDNQIRSLLISPEFRINEDLLIRNCEHLGREGAVNTLFRLARGARGLNRVIKEQTIYNMLLKNFTETNNYEAALDLYERLEDDQLNISQEFLRNLVQLLRTNNVEIPSNIALRAQIL